MTMIPILLVLQAAVGAPEAPSLAYEFGFDKQCAPVVRILEATPAILRMNSELLARSIRERHFSDEAIPPAYQIDEGIGRSMLDSDGNRIAHCVVAPELVLLHIQDGGIGRLVDLDGYADGKLVISRMVSLSQFQIEFRQASPIAP